jgi:hypothetical protein
MAVEGIGAHANNVCLALVKAVEIPLKPARFQRATRGEILRVEIKHEPTAGKVGQRKLHRDRVPMAFRGWGHTLKSEWGSRNIQGWQISTQGKCLFAHEKGFRRQGESHQGAW